MNLNELSYKVISCALEVHRNLGPGLLETVYETCFCDEMSRSGLMVSKQVHCPIIYKGSNLEKSFFIDVLVENALIVELKSVETILPVHEYQLLTYLKLSGKKLGLLINFNVPILKEGIRRKINGNIEN